MNDTSAVPTSRWEWRTFGDTLGDAEVRIRSLGAPTVRSSTEIYVLAPAGMANTKLRGGALEIKTLEGTGADGLEKWSPLLVSGFPLAPEVVARLRNAWSLKASALARAAASLAGLLAVVASPESRLSAVAVAKERFGFSADGVAVEFANLTFDGRPARTAAVLDENPVRVRETLRALGLTHLENINYVKALRRFQARRAA